MVRRQGRPEVGVDVGVVVAGLEEPDPGQRSQQPRQRAGVGGRRLGEPVSRPRLDEVVEDAEPAACADRHRHPGTADHPHDVGDRVLAHAAPPRAQTQDGTAERAASVLLLRPARRGAAGCPRRRVRSTMPRAMVWAFRPIRSRIACRSACWRNSCGMPCSENGVVTPSSVSSWSSAAADAADPAVVLDADHQPVVAGQPDQGGVERLDPARVDDGDADALGREPLADLDPDRGHRARRRRRARPWRRGVARTSQPPARSTASMSAGGAPFGRRTTVGRVVDGHGLAQQLAHPGAVARRGDAQTRARPGGSRGPTCRCGSRRRCR